MHFLEIRLALRNLFRNRFYTLLNVSGLAISLATVILIAGSIRDELNWDSWHVNGDQISRLTLQMMSQEGQPFSAFSMPGIAPELTAALPQVEAAARVTWPFEMRVRQGDQPMELWDNVRLVDPEFLTIFTIPLAVGDPLTALNEPNSVVLSHETAIAFFGDQNPIGETFLLNERTEVQVTGVTEPLPGNTHLPFNMLAPIQIYGDETLSSWGWMNFGTYLLLAEGTTDLDKTALWEEFFYPRVDRSGLELGLQPLNEIHFAGDLVDGIQAGVTTRYQVYGLASIALLILIIATINFMNLSASLATRRIREVSVMKVIGARRSNLIVQMLVESVFIALFAGAFALLIAELVLPHYAQLISQPSLPSLFSDFQILTLHGMVTIIVGLLAGLYPALLFSSYRPSSALKGEIVRGVKVSRVRQTLVVAQFSISIIFIAGTFLINHQLAFASRMDLGFEKENVLLLSSNRDFRASFDDYLNRFRNLPEIQAATYASGIPGNSIGQTSILPEGQEERIALRYLSVEEQALETFGLEMVEGRFFSTDFPFDRLTDSTGNVILNEAAVRYLGWDGPVVGRTVQNGSEEWSSTVVGVVKDFNQKSLHNKIEPMMLIIYPQWSNTIALRYKTNNLPVLIEDITELWEEIMPAYPAQISFVDEQLNELYQEDRQQSTILRLSSVLAMFVASLGMVGLATFAAQRRTKEVGVRKVLGASVLQVARILVKEFMLLAIIANVVAWPVAIILMNRWLDSFAYHVTVAWWILPVAGLIAVVLVVLVTGLIAVRAGALKPVDMLRCE
jgi:putative ABC transport system permease protein